MEALAALKARRVQTITKPAAQPVTKIAAVTKLPEPKTGKRGRPKVHANATERQRARRARLKASA